MNRNVIKHKLSKNKYLTQIEPFKTSGIPTDIILFKNIPGCGATRCEIEISRHSIILEPNVPVIRGKAIQFGKLVCGIYEDVTIEDIIAYLQSEVKYKKLIVTPESFYKIKEAMLESAFDLYTDFFLLFDECEKIIQDINFRPDISLPMDDFFQFKNKAFVSATPILPSDPRFEVNNFKIHSVAPTYNYAENLELIITNNVITSLKNFIDGNPRDKYFIFLNSTDTINAVIQSINIKSESMIFCADNSRKKLLLNDYLKSNVKTELSEFKKYNFFTSRFYSAVDIEYETYKCSPTIIIISEVIGATYSMVDPLTHVIQMQGRFRVPQRKSVKKEIVHITNINSELTWMTPEESLDYLKECHTVYKVINRYCESATTNAAKDVLRQMLQKIDYAKYLKGNTEERNFDMVDNLLLEERVKSYYQLAINLISVYGKTPHFNFKYTSENYSFTDAKRLRASQKNLRLKSMNVLLSETLQELHTRMNRNEITEFQYQMEIANLQSLFIKQMAPINRFGIDRSAELNFDIRLIEKKIIQEKKEVDHFGMMTFIHSNFTVGIAYTNDDVKAILKRGFKANKIFGIIGGIQYLRKYAKLSESNNRILMGKTSDGKEIRGYRLIRFRDNPQ